MFMTCPFAVENIILLILLMCYIVIMPFTSQPFLYVFHTYVILFINPLVIMKHFSQLSMYYILISKFIILMLLVIFINLLLVEYGTLILNNSRSSIPCELQNATLQCHSKAVCDMGY